MTRSEYEDMIRKKPSLRPTEVIKSQNTHSSIVEGFKESLAKLEAEPSFEQQNASLMPKTLVFTIPGQPVGKPRMTQQDKWKKRPCVVKYWEWADKARASLEAVFVHPVWRGMGAKISGFREVHFKAYLGFPKTYSKKKRKALAGEPHLLRGDGDNFLKAIQDSLFDEDGCIWKFSGEKRWDDGRGARVEVELR